MVYRICSTFFLMELADGCNFRDGRVKFLLSTDRKTSPSRFRLEPEMVIITFEVDRNHVRQSDRLCAFIE